MKRYEEYKDSDVQWFGKIPSHWIIGKLKYMAKVYTGKTPSTNNDNYYKEEDINWITPGDISDNNYYIAEVQNKISRIAIEDNACQLYPSGSIFVVCVGTIGKVCLTTFDASCNQQINVLVPNGCNNKFLTYYIMSIKEILKLNANASLLAIISQEKTKNIVTLIPPINEQQSIASFLDAKTKPIDDIISKREKQIELLEEMKSAIISHAVTKGLNLDAKMKDSGIEWIGEIPERWSIIRLKHLASLYGRIGYRGYTQQDIVPQGEGAITISPSNMVRGYMDFEKCTYLSWAKYNESPEIMIHNNDILLVKTGSTYGKVAIVKNIPLEATINPQIVAIKNIKCNPDLLNYILCTPYVHLQVENTVIGSTIPTISQEKINNYVFAMPPADEQQAIASYLASETSKLDARIAKHRRQIELLQEYKQALITDAVTGKIDVRGFNS